MNDISIISHYVKSI